MGKQLILGASHCSAVHFQRVGPKIATISAQSREETDRLGMGVDDEETTSSHCGGNDGPCVGMW